MDFDEFSERVAQQADRQHMKMTEKKTRIESFIYGLKSDDLFTMSQIFEMCASDPRAATYFEGIVDALLKDRHNICSYCGIDHDENVLGGHGKNNEPVKTPHSGTIENAIPSGNDSKTSSDAKNFAPEEEYHVDILASGKAVCTRCGYTYPSLEDRMLRRPEECHGCQIKAQFG